jgi:hypothetical protein
MSFLAWDKSTWEAARAFLDAFRLQSGLGCPLDIEMFESALQTDDPDAPAWIREANPTGERS